MKPEIGFVGLLTTQDVRDDIRFALENGFSWFELALDWPQGFDLSQRTLEEIGRTCSQCGLKLVVHTGYYLPTACPIPEIREAVAANLTRAIELAVRVGSDRITVHPGIQDLPQSAAEVCIQSLVANLRQAVDIGQRYGVCFCLENFPSEGHALCANLEEFQRVLSSIWGIGVTLDVGHANTTGQSPEEYFTVLRSLIKNMHIHDNSGKVDEHKCPGEGSVDFSVLLSQCKAAGYKGPFMLELFPHENILKGKETFLRFWEQGSTET